jgi:hypothetical protein
MPTAEGLLAKKQRFIADFSAHAATKSRLSPGANSSIG